MGLQVTIDGTSDPAEVAFALQHLAGRIRDEDESAAAGPLLDSSGNEVGHAEVMQNDGS